jgi:hypothetical protein
VNPRSRRLRRVPPLKDDQNIITGLCSSSWRSAESSVSKYNNTIADSNRIQPKPLHQPPCGEIGIARGEDGDVVAMLGLDAGAVQQ